MGKDRVLVSAHPIEEAAQYRRECQRYRRDSDGGENGPEQEGVPLPEPELAGEGEWVFTRGVEEFVRGERHGRSVEDSAGDVDEWNDQDKLERIDDVVADLRGGYVEAEDESYSEAEDGGAAEDGVDANEDAGSYAPCEFFGCGSHAEKREDGKGDAPVEPVVVDGRRRLRWGVEIGRDRLHYGQDRLRNEGLRRRRESLKGEVATW